MTDQTPSSPAVTSDTVAPAHASVPLLNPIHDESYYRTALAQKLYDLRGDLSETEEKVLVFEIAALIVDAIKTLSDSRTSKAVFDLSVAIESLVNTPSRGNGDAAAAAADSHTAPPATPPAAAPAASATAEAPMVKQYGLAGKPGKHPGYADLPALPQTPPMDGRWNKLLEGVREPTDYGNTPSYKKGADFLRGMPVEDWGCASCFFKKFHSGQYKGIDGSTSPLADVQGVDLRFYRSETPGLFMRHVLEHNVDWKPILRNALASFQRRMVLVVFTPWSHEGVQKVLRTVNVPGPIPDISLPKEQIEEEFARFGVTIAKEEEMASDRTKYGVEHIFYLEKKA